MMRGVRDTIDDPVRVTIGGWWYVRSASRRDGMKIARRFIAGNPNDPSPGTPSIR